MTPTQKELIKEIAKYYGADSQSNQLIEECAELIQAVNKYRRARKNDDYETIISTRNNLVEEIADVEIMIGQIKYLHAISDEVVEDIIERKIKRTRESFRSEK